MNAIIIEGVPDDARLGALHRALADIAHGSGRRLSVELDDCATVYRLTPTFVPLNRPARPAAIETFISTMGGAEAAEMALAEWVAGAHS